MKILGMTKGRAPAFSMVDFYCWQGIAMPFKKGQSGNPQGRRVECLPEIKDLARQHTKEAIERLVEWMRSKDPKASPFAAKELLNRGWGHSPQYHDHSGELRNHIISDRPMTTDAWVATYCSGKPTKTQNTKGMVGRWTTAARGTSPKQAPP